MSPQQENLIPVQSPENQLVPLDIYLANDFLPASQYAKMLTTLDALYEVIVRDSFDEHEPFLLDYFLESFRSTLWPKVPWLPLCIDSVETGQSVTVRFAAKSESGTVVWHERNIDIILSRSTAPLCAIGVMLTGGAWSYAHYLDAQYEKAQTEQVQEQTEVTRAQKKLTAAQVELTRAQTANILEKRVAFKP